MSELASSVELVELPGSFAVGSSVESIIHQAEWTVHGPPCTASASSHPSDGFMPMVPNESALSRSSVTLAQAISGHPNPGRYMNGWE